MLSPSSWTGAASLGVGSLTCCYDHRNPLRNRTQRIRRHLRRRQSHRILRVKHTVAVQRVTARRTSIISPKQSNAEPAEPPTPADTSASTNAATPVTNGAAAEDPDQIMYPLPGAAAIISVLGATTAIEIPLSRRALRNLLIPVNTAHRQHARNRRRSTNLRQAATAVPAAATISTPFCSA